MAAELGIAVRLTLGPGELALDLATEARTIGIVGPSGAGKSTLLRVVAGLERRARGTITFRGEAWQAEGVFVPPWQRGAGWVPQDAVLFPHLSVRQNLGFAARVAVLPIAERLGVAHLLDRRPRHLSGGERQRVALGRALCADPRLLLLDEPFAALDKPLRARLAADVAAWARERGATLLVVTHDDADLAALTEEAWEIRDGGLSRGDPAHR